MMDGLPLALDQAGAYIQETQKSVKEYVTLYTDQVKRTQLLHQRGELITNHPESVTTTFTLSFEKIKNTDRAAAYLLQLCAFLHPDAIPEEVLIEAVQMLIAPEKTEEREKAIAVLLRYSQLRRNPDSRTYTLHRIVQAVLKDMLPADQQRDWAEQTITILNHTPIPFDEKKRERRTLAQLYLPHAQQCALYIQMWNIQSAEALELLNRAGAYLYQQRQYGAAQPFYEQLLHITEQKRGASDLDKARALSILANLTYLQKADRQKLLEAAQRYQEALHIYERELAPNDPCIGQVLTHYGMLLRRLKRWRGVEAVEVRARHIGKKMTAQSKKRWISRWVGNLNVTRWYDGYNGLLVIVFYIAIRRTSLAKKLWHWAESRDLLNWNKWYGLWVVWGMVYFVAIVIPITVGFRLQSWWWGLGSFIPILLGLIGSFSSSFLSIHPTENEFSLRFLKFLRIYGEIFLGIPSFLLFTVEPLIWIIPLEKVLLTLHWSMQVQYLLQIVFFAIIIIPLSSGFPFFMGPVLYERHRLRNVVPKYTILPIFTYLSSLCVLPVLFGLLFHSWWMFGAVLLGTWSLVIFLTRGWESTIVSQRHIIAFIFGCLWGYLGWMVADVLSMHMSNSYWQQSLPFLLALMGFSVGFFGHNAACMQLHIMGAEENITFVLEDLWIDSAISTILARVASEPIVYWEHFYFMLGLSYNDTKRYADAIANFTMSIVNDPEDPFVYNLRGLAYKNQGDFTYAIADYNQAISLNPNEAMFYNNRGVAYYDQGDYTCAIIDYNQAISLNPEFALAYNNRGTAYHDQGDYIHAINDFDQAISFDPNEALYHASRDQAYQKLSDYDHTVDVKKERFDTFTEQTRRIFIFAKEEAQRFQHTYIGTEHLLLGLVREEDSIAGKVLHRLGVELNQVRNAVEFIIGRGDRIVQGEIGLTPRAKKVIELAIDEARRLNHHYIGTEHLLLGLIREGEGIAWGVLESLGVNLEKVRTQTIQILKDLA